MGGLVRDLGYAARGLRRNPGFALAAVLTLAIGIGANTALFSLVDSILWRPFPYADDASLVVVESANSARGLRWGNLSLPDIRELGDQAELLQGLAAWDWEPYGLAGGEEPLRVGGARVSWGFFDVLGVPPLLGRTFREGEDRPGAEPVVVLSEGLWRSYFAGDPDIVGRSVRINSRPTTIVGVIPGGAEYPDRTRLWVPLTFDEESAPRGVNFLGTIGRLRSGANLSAANAEVQTIGQRFGEAYPEDKDRAFRAISLREELTGDMEPMSLSLLGVVTFVLLIVCANVAHLLLARGASREREVAIRRALGASGARLVQLLLCESFLLTLAGSALGWGIGWLGLEQIVRSLPSAPPPWVQTSMDGRNLLYTLGLSVVAAALFSLFPLLQNLGVDLTGALHRGAGRSSSGIRGRRLRSVLVVAEVTLSAVLLAGAAVMVQSLLALGAVQAGFRPDGGLAVGLDLLAQADAPPEVRAGQLQRFLDRFEAVPGVQAVGATAILPMTGRGNTVGVVLEGQSAEEGRENPPVQTGVVTPGFFAAMGIPLLFGEDFDARPASEGPEHAVVSQAMAETLWPGESPIGKRLRFGWREDAWMTVRGVVGDIHHRGLDQPEEPQLYVEYRRAGAPERMTVILRYEGDAAALTGAVREAAREIDAAQPLHEVRTLEDLVGVSVWRWRFFALISWIFGLVAALLAVIGIYGVMSYTVSQRTQEVGIRMALGSSRGRVAVMVMRQGGMLLGLGLGLALPLSIGLQRILSGFLFSVSGFEPLALIAASLLLALVAVPALLLPAQRAARVDPAISLRAE